MFDPQISTFFIGIADPKLSKELLVVAIEPSVKNLLFVSPAWPKELSLCILDSYLVTHLMKWLLHLTSTDWGFRRWSFMYKIHVQFFCLYVSYPGTEKRCPSPLLCLTNISCLLRCCSDKSVISVKFYHIHPTKLVFTFLSLVYSIIL